MRLGRIILNEEETTYKNCSKKNKNNESCVSFEEKYKKKGIYREKVNVHQGSSGDGGVVD